MSPFSPVIFVIHVSRRSYPIFASSHTCCTNKEYMNIGRLISTAPLPLPPPLPLLLLLRRQATLPSFLFVISSTPLSSFFYFSKMRCTSLSPPPPSSLPPLFPLFTDGGGGEGGGGEGSPYCCTFGARWFNPVRVPNPPPFLYPPSATIFLGFLFLLFLSSSPHPPPPSFPPLSSITRELNSSLKP